MSSVRFTSLLFFFSTFYMMKRQSSGFSEQNGADVFHQSELSTSLGNVERLGEKLLPGSHFDGILSYDKRSCSGITSEPS